MTPHLPHALTRSARDKRAGEQQGRSASQHNYHPFHTQPSIIINTCFARYAQHRQYRWRLVWYSRHLATMQRMGKPPWRGLFKGPCLVPAASPYRTTSTAHSLQHRPSIFSSHGAIYDASPHHGAICVEGGLGLHWRRWWRWIVTVTSASCLDILITRLRSRVLNTHCASLLTYTASNSRRGWALSHLLVALNPQFPLRARATITIRMSLTCVCFWLVQEHIHVCRVTRLWRLLGRQGEPGSRIEASRVWLPVEYSQTQRL